ncbi:unnamed protein product [Cylindrotheca closterium]|uniref:HSF-type DNA-binding domain-containing protein n=1 Tax=Cylindrotheca closterium TaxID=2856 RepID=A0AAD2JI60_9STRA|nr:unnamed protein product [Cylindrotheca closterium]
METTNVDLNNGLSHLVEAATALTALIETPKVTTTTTATSSSSKSAVESPDTVVSDDDEYRQPAEASMKSSPKREIFPQKLMEILSDETLSDVVSWLPHGRSFVVVRPDIFTAKVLPKYLPPIDSRSSTKYPSFTRKLNRWGFRQATKGPDSGAFHHPLFRRDNPELCLQMECKKTKERQMVRKRSLPPKKRGIIERPTSGHPDQNETSIDHVVPSSPLVTADDRSVVSFGGSTTTCSSISNRERTGVPPSSILSSATETKRVTPSISNDAAFVAKVLLQRDQNEILLASRMMLMNAYIQALHGVQGKTPKAC